MINTNVWKLAGVATAALLVLGIARSGTGQLSSTASWQYSPLTSSIGKRGLVISSPGSSPEILVTDGGSNRGSRRWSILRYNTGTQDFEQVFVSPAVEYPDGIVNIAAGDLLPLPGPEIVVIRGQGQVEIWHQARRTRVLVFQKKENPGPSGLLGLCLGDVDGDSKLDIIISALHYLFAYGADGKLKWEMNMGGGQLLVAGQMDTDPGLEIASNTGTVVDAATRTIQWSRSSSPFDISLDLADIDNDKILELIAYRQDTVYAFDVDKKLTRWSLKIGDQGSLAVADVDRDGVQEVVVGTAQHAPVSGYDAVTLKKEWTIPGNNYGTTRLACADVDGDAKIEILWGDNDGTSSPQHLCVGDWSTGLVEWSSRSLSGPLLGPAVGDVDGNGFPELVSASGKTEGSKNGSLLVFDGATLRLQAVSPPVCPGSFAATAIRLHNIDKDAALEIVVASTRTIEIHDFDGTGFKVAWTSAAISSYDGSFYDVALGDLDGDSTDEVVGARKNHFHVYDLATGQERWQSPALLDTPYLREVEITNTDFDPGPEILVLGDGNPRGHLYIFDGKTRQLEATLKGEFSTLRTLKGGSRSLILLGDRAGRLWAFEHDGQGYRTPGWAYVSLSSVDGFTYIPPCFLFVGSAGRLTAWLGTTPIWQSDQYGQTFGKHLVILPYAGMGVTSGSDGLAGFKPYGARTKSAE